MNFHRDDILRMAREAGFITGTRDYADGNGAMPFVQSIATGTFLPELERLTTLVSAAERQSIALSLIANCTELNNAADPVLACVQFLRTGKTS